MTNSIRPLAPNGASHPHAPILKWAHRLQRLTVSRLPIITGTLSLLSALGCTKVEPYTPFGCRVANGGAGIGGISNPRAVMFWSNSSINCRPRLVSIRNTETNGAFYGRLSAADMMAYFTKEPACGTYGPVAIQLSKGYEYEYTFTCGSRQLKGIVTVDCSSDDCVAVELR